MNELLQTAQHPDADQLTAFAEHALPAHEREQTLAHLATCAACRQLVFLAQAEEPAEAAQPVAVKKPWFAGWNLVWPAALALAGIVAFSVHLRHVTTGVAEQQKVAIVTEAPPIPAAPVLAPSLPPRVAAAPMPRAVAKVASPVAPPLVAASNGPLQQQSAALPAQDQLSPGPLGKRERVPALPLHGPMATQQQMAGAGVAARASGQSYVQAPVSLAQAPPPAPAPPRPIVAAAGTIRTPAAAPPPPAALTPGETMRTAAASAPAPAPKALAQAAPQAAAQDAASQTIDVSAMTGMAVSNATSLDGKAMLLAELPSGRATVSKVSNGSRTVALDASGAVFVSKDDGRHWTTVKAQWSGRAVQVSLTGTPPASRGRNLSQAAPQAKAERGLSIAHNAVADGTQTQINGSVADASGAVIAGATIRVKNTAGADVANVRADANGKFLTGALDPGKYSVQVSAPGFAAFNQTLELQARDRASLGVSLQVGAESQTVTVSAADVEVEQTKPKPEPFTLTTDAGVTWTSQDGQKWKRQ